MILSQLGRDQPEGQATRQRSVRYVGPVLEQPVQVSHSVSGQAEPRPDRGHEGAELHRPENVPDRKRFLRPDGTNSSSGKVRGQQGPIL